VFAFKLLMLFVMWWH